MPQTSPTPLNYSGCLDGSAVNIINGSFTQPLAWLTSVTGLTNPTAATDLLTYLFPANAINSTGKSFRITCAGKFNLGAASTLVFTIKLAGVTLATVTCASVATTATDLKWTLDVDVLIATTGTAATALCNATARTGVTSLTTALNTYGDSNTAALSAINLVQPALLEVMFNLGTGNAGSTITLHAPFLELLN